MSSSALWRIRRALLNSGGSFTRRPLSTSRDGKVSEIGPLRKFGWYSGAFLLFGATVATVSSTLDDIVIYESCSRKAMDMVSKDTRIKKCLGEHIRRGFWHEVSLGTAHEGRSISCTFPIYGAAGTASLYLKAVRSEGARSSIVYNLLESGKWEVLILEALLNEGNGDRRINLMETESAPKSGDKSSNLSSRLPTKSV